MYEIPRFNIERNTMAEKILTLKGLGSPGRAFCGEVHGRYTDFHQRPSGELESKPAGWSTPT
jgi:hypothetical protein